MPGPKKDETPEEREVRLQKMRDYAKKHRKKIKDRYDEYVRGSTKRDMALKRGLKADKAGMSRKYKGPREGRPPEFTPPPADERPLDSAVWSKFVDYVEKNKDGIAKDVIEARNWPHGQYLWYAFLAGTFVPRRSD